MPFASAASKEELTATTPWPACSTGTPLPGAPPPVDRCSQPLLRVLEPHCTRRPAGSPASAGHPLTPTDGTWRCGAVAPVPWGPLPDTPSLEWGPSPKERKRRGVADRRGCAGTRAGTATAMLPRRLQHPAARRLPRGHQESDSGLLSVRILQR